MKYLVGTILIVVGLINFFPVIGLVSVDNLAQLYAIEFRGTDEIILMRHRAALFGLLGGFIALSAFRPELQVLACMAGLISMLVFVGLALSAGSYGEALNKAVVADIIGSVGLIIVLLLRWFGRKEVSE